VIPKSEISWTGVTRVSPFLTRDGRVAAAASPALVWIRDPANPSHTKATEAAFADASVGIGSRAFRTLTIKPADAAADPLLAPYARGTALLIVSREHAVESVLVEPRLAATDVYLSMLASAGKAYADDLRVAVDTTREVRVELARVAADRRALAFEPLTDATRRARNDALDARERTAREREQHAWPLHARTV